MSMFPPQMIDQAEALLVSLGFEFRIVDKCAKYVNDSTGEDISYTDAAGVLVDDGRLSGWRVTGNGTWLPCKVKK